MYLAHFTITLCLACWCLGQSVREEEISVTCRADERDRARRHTKIPLVGNSKCDTSLLLHHHHHHKQQQQLSCPGVDFRSFQVFRHFPRPSAHLQLLTRTSVWPLTISNHRSSGRPAGLWSQDLPDTTRLGIAGLGYIHKVPATFYDNLQCESHKPYAPPTCHVTAAAT